MSDKIKAVVVEYASGGAARWEGSGGVLCTNAGRISKPDDRIHFVTAQLQIEGQPWPRAGEPREACMTPHELLGELLEFVSENFTQEGRYKHDPAKRSHLLIPDLVRGAGAAWGPWRR